MILPIKLQSIFDGRMWFKQKSIKTLNQCDISSTLQISAVSFNFRRFFWKIISDKSLWHKVYFLNFSFTYSLVALFWKTTFPSTIWNKFPFNTFFCHISSKDNQKPCSRFDSHKEVIFFYFFLFFFFCPIKHDSKRNNWSKYSFFPKFIIYL